MNILGVGPGEIMFILILMLVVLGPERLPVFAQQAGRMIVGLRNWIQRSPDAAMVLRMRTELEQELETIRASITQEVNSIRDEVMEVRGDLIDAARQIEDAAESVAKTRIEVDVDQIVAGDVAPQAAAAADPVAQIAAGSTQTATKAGADPGDNGQPVPRSTRPTWHSAAAGTPADVALSRAELDVIERRIEAIMNELGQLQTRVRSAAGTIADTAIDQPEAAAGITEPPVDAEALARPADDQEPTQSPAEAGTVDTATLAPDDPEPPGLAMGSETSATQESSADRVAAEPDQQSADPAEPSDTVQIQENQ
ncbi:MAG TPA: hypothetical protein PKA05_06505 [Roseiflexaceae bacterium]|nr:hypothetical protein [Roseiflexaceae bacterium]HMP40015.1 hypothetical protein [Roseiflexaceae bacterium]